MIYVIAELRVKPGTADKAIAAARLSVAETVKENGCISYDMHQSVTDPFSRRVRVRLVGCTVSTCTCDICSDGMVNSSAVLPSP